MLPVVNPTLGTYPPTSPGQLPPRYSHNGPSPRMTMLPSNDTIECCCCTCHCSCPSCPDEEDCCCCCVEGNCLPTTCCCGGGTLRGGSIAIAYYTLIFNVILLASGSFHIDLVIGSEIMFPVTCTRVALAAIMVFNSILLIIALLSASRVLQLPWIIFMTLTTLFDISISSWLLSEFEFDPFSITLFTLNYVFSLLNIYCIFIVSAYFDSLYQYKSGLFKMHSRSHNYRLHPTTETFGYSDDDDEFKGEISNFQLNPVIDVPLMKAPRIPRYDKYGNILPWTEEDEEKENAKEMAEEKDNSNGEDEAKENEEKEHQCRHSLKKKKKSCKKQKKKMKEHKCDCGHDHGQAEEEDDSNDGQETSLEKDDEEEEEEKVKEKKKKRSKDKQKKKKDCCSGCKPTATIVTTPPSPCPSSSHVSIHSCGSEALSKLPRKSSLKKVSSLPAPNYLT